MKVLTILGARPQFIKAATVSRAISEHNAINPDCPIQELIVHTGQHFDANMSQIFFDQLEIPKPNFQLNISSLPHGAMTGRMLEAVEELIQQQTPDCVLVYGDTNSTLAGALAASKLRIPIAHVEAGLRSNNMAMPEEINRVLTDRLSDLLFCPTPTAINNLEVEGFPFKTVMRQQQWVENTGDVMYDATLFYQEKIKSSVLLGEFGVEEKAYVLCTLHRQENTDDMQRLLNILAALSEIAVDICPVLLPLHPRTRKKIDEVLFGCHLLNRIRLLEPLGYFQMQRLESGAKMILTDSGGVQKEAFFHGVPCITLRNETEWAETLENGWNQLVGVDCKKILAATEKITEVRKPSRSFGNGQAAEKIVTSLSRLEFLHLS